MRNVFRAGLLTIAVLLEVGCATRAVSLPPRKMPEEKAPGVAVDARWSNYGAYLQKVITTVQSQWDRILIQNSSYPPSGSTVIISFVMDRNGDITKITHVETTSSDAGKQACISALTAKAPYPKWTPDMVVMLGESQEMTFTFYYQ